ncbi:MAG: lipoyl synthase [Campylobacterota bacterium]|nr:lipoyl synthase [Campylobacterota bacterium]
MRSKIERKPEWLRKKITPSVNRELEAMFSRGQINTVCQEAMCPNISECFSHRQATFLILGTLCTRACSFCGVDRGRPMRVDADEPTNIAQTVDQLGLRHVVITSPTRDDLSDGGAEQFCQTVDAIKEIDSSIAVELLISDMRGDRESIEKIAHSGAEIVGHNVETIPRCYDIRRGSEYKRSLGVLQILSSANHHIATKSGIMLGFGERDDEVETLMQELLDVGCRYLSIGQYLRPSSHHTPVVEYVEPERFDNLKRVGIKMGFSYIKSSPYTRSSYIAHEYIKGGS